ncbi:dihydrolipoamide acetyltransferase family protein [Natronoflexus pectinivorans]|uniref:Dihydrolipoamide acetyltransferase component of pyruvate dehydrogenase complex n=1 Tax=Natronoflexus pectinivorans TaxID=682526 RepID=A0A4R2GHB5_9BACT|nr:dihydrolipoamide acetyltransferase family protein [Natronoflexus pectinivorans]TCO07727.1 pyruvate dehydrogenase E2 component (dihydrolipoamide acetyltransferase) [Natronoflexus pectinivorans]
MATVIIMPKQGQSVESCIITEFNKKKGDKVNKGDVLFAYETDKASFEEESPIDGVLLELFFDEGDEVPVLTNVCVVGEEGESVEDFRPGGDEGASKTIETPEKEIVESTSITEDAAPAQTPEPPASANQSFGVSPRARNLAEKNGIDLQSIAGTGPGGRVIERDVSSASQKQGKVTPLAKQLIAEENLQAGVGSGLGGMITSNDLQSGNPVYGEGFEIKPLTNMRKLIAKAMHASLQNSAQLTHHLGADARRILELRKKAKAALDNGYPINITLNDMICFAVIKALKQFPQVNAHFMGDGMKLFKKVHFGLAVDTDRGLMVPVVKNADDLSIKGLASQFKEIANACRKGGISPELLASDAASFTVSNLGNYGVEMFTPVINLPQVAILGVNTIVPRPKDLGDGVYGFVPYLGLSLTYDHRALDGGEATRFVKQVAIEIENLEIDFI